MEPKKNPQFDYGRNSSFYFSLGLICALSLSFVVLQTEFKETDLSFSKTEPIEEHDLTFEQPIDKKIKIIDAQVKKTTLITDKIKVVKEDFNPTEKEPTPVDELLEPGTVEGTKEPAPINPKDIMIIDEVPIVTVEDFKRIEDVPIFPGCEKLAKDEHRACFEKKLKEHVMKHQRFPNQAIEIGLSGRVNAQFIIDETGQVKVAAMRGSHPMFEKEVQRVLSLLPKMTPGKQRLKAVKVSYALPFTFKID